MISYVDKIVGMRREEVMMKNEFPGELQGAFNGIETNGNPWNISAMDRGDWADGLDIPLLSDKPDAEVLYWVGCAASYDDRAKKVARAVSKLLKKARVDFAILGTEETCTGDPARRAGNEYLFQMLAEQNIETLNGYEAAKKTIITACPHCFNILGNEYADFGGAYDVVHHSDFLNGLLVAGKLIPSKAVKDKVVYHDSCYLGRYNQVYDSPRQILEAIEGLELTEVPYWNRNKGLCCGAGGAQMFMEEQGQERVNNKRTLQLIDTGATTIASGCPFCMTMLTDGLKDEEKEETIAQRDIAEILADAIELDEVEQTPVAAQ
jgi:Fe-S oxidoreductase